MSTMPADGTSYFIGCGLIAPAKYTNEREENEKVINVIDDLWNSVLY